MAWISLKDLDSSEALKMIADYSRVKFTNPDMSAKAVRWAFYRYSPEITLVGDDPDLAAAKSAGLSSDQSFMAFIYSDNGVMVNPLLREVALDVMQAMGGSEFRRWLVGREHLKNCYSEVLAVMSETDEDKRAVVLLKRNELFDKVGAQETSLEKLAASLFKVGDGDSIEHLARFVNPEGTAKAAYGSEEEDD